MSFTNQARDYYNPGTDLTTVATTPVRGKTFAAIAGPRTRNLLSTTTAQPGTLAAGVFKYDAAAEELVGLARGASRILTVTAEVQINAGETIYVGNDGKATNTGDGIAVGYAVDNADADSDVLVSLNQ